MMRAMRDATSLHSPPRWPHVAAWVALASQLAIAVLWWQLGWRVGLPLLLGSHALLLWGTLRPQSALFGPVLTRLPTTQPVVWLTIDDGPSDDTVSILELLDAYEAKATFFVVAERALARPHLVQAIVARGHTLGNHSASHPSAWFWALGPSRMAAEIGRAQAVLREVAGVEPRWFRAVVGMANPFVAVPLRALGLARVAWSARGFDAVRADPAAVVARLEPDLLPGAIVLMHEGAAHRRSVEAIALLLQHLQQRRLRCILPESLPNL